MLTIVTNNIVVDGWTVLDGSDNPLTGVTSPAGVSLTLQRQSGSTIVAAAESVAWTEIGATGRYYFSFTPVQTGLYVLYGKELHASSTGRTFEFRYQVVSAGALFSASYANAFCAESDIERWLQQAITATTKPNDTEAAAFAESRAAALASLCARWGVTVPPVTAGSRLEDLLREANAIGAALDYTVAQQFSYQPSTSDRAERYQTLWDQYVAFIEAEIRGNLASLSTNHILSGDTLAATATSAPTDSGVGPIGMGSLF